MQYISVTNLELVLLGVGVWVCLAAIERYFYRSDIPDIMGDIEFRDVARVKQKLTEEECLDILRKELRGVLSVNGDHGYPYGMPINHYYNDDDGLIYFHGGKKGHRTDSFRKDDRASYCVMDKGTLSEDGWSLDFRSVIVFGRIEEVNDPERMIDIVRRLSLRFTKDLEYIEDEIERHGSHTLMFALRPEHITGKRVNES